jgi:hypothetical protein
VDRPGETPPGNAFPPSPCVDICKLNEKQVCIGCKRTIREIADWTSMTAERQWQVVRSLPGRQIS